MTALAMFGGNKVSLKDQKSMIGALRGAATAEAGSDLPDGGVYVNFSGKMGKYSIGQDKEDADPKEIWLINVFSFEAGWMCWKGGQPAAKRFASIYGAPVAVPDMAEHGPFRDGEGWYSAKAFMMRSLDSGRQGYFSTNTKSAMREFGKIEGEVARRLEEGLPCWPVITLGKEKFVAQGKTNWKPILEVVGWLGMPQVNEMAKLEDTSEILEALDDLLDAAAEMEAQGIPDTTLSGADEEDAFEDEGAEEDFDEGFEDEAEEEDEAEDEAEEEIEEAEVVEEKSARRSLKDRAAAAKEGKPARAGLRRRA